MIFGGRQFPDDHEQPDKGDDIKGAGTQISVPFPPGQDKQEEQFNQDDSHYQRIVSPGSRPPVGDKYDDSQQDDQ